MIIAQSKKILLETPDKDLDSIRREIQQMIINQS